MEVITTGLKEEKRGLCDREFARLWRLIKRAYHVTSNISIIVD